MMTKQYRHLSSPLRGFLGDGSVSDLGLGLGLDSHNASTPVPPVLVELLVEVGLDSLNDLRELVLVLVLHGCQAQGCCSLGVHNLGRRKIAFR